MRAGSRCSTTFQRGEYVAQALLVQTQRCLDGSFFRVTQHCRVGRIRLLVGGQPSQRFLRATLAPLRIAGIERTSRGCHCIAKWLKQGAQKAVSAATWQGSQRRVERNRIVKQQRNRALRIADLRIEHVRVAERKLEHLCSRGIFGQ
jgi:hypothetical protein